MSATLWDLVFFAVAFLAATGCAYYYVRGVLDEDRLLSRSAAVAFFLFGVVAAVSLLRALL
jgi:hypothetical protein